MAKDESHSNTTADQPGLSDNASASSRLENAARELAKTHFVSPRPRRRRPLVERLQEQETLLREAYYHYARLSEAQSPLSYAAEWLLDNFYVVQQGLRQIREHMPAGYYRQLPKLDSSSLAGYPRVYAVAREIIRCCEGQLDLDRVTTFVRAYQEVSGLTIGELWALPTMLRVGMLENLTGSIVRLMHVPGQRGEEVSTVGPSAEQVADEAMVANSILSLRMVATEDWKAFFEQVSLVEEVLRRDPAKVYAATDFNTRNLCRQVVEELARATGRDQQELALEAIKVAEAAPRSGQASPRLSHVGFYLLDAGRPQLEKHLGYCPSWGARLRRWLFSHAALVYLGAAVLLTLVILVSAAGYVLGVGGKPIHLIGVALFFLLPATAVAINLVNWVITHTVPPRVLPRLDFQEGIPAEYRTMVVIPALLTNPGEVTSLLQQLELHYLGNADRHLHFALLTDFADAPSKDMPGDDALLEQVRVGIEALNDKYSQGSGSSFFVFHRERQWNPAESCWMGWERKRGKLVEFNRLLGGSTDTSYIVQVGDLTVLREIKYAITLDADTSLPRDSAAQLIATLAHPLNRAQFDPQTGAVTAGYTVLQPRVEIMPTSVTRSLFMRVFSGDTGLDLYTRAVSDAYHDFLGEGIYVGKGIYDVAAFDRTLAGRVPDNALLSHDLFEGIHGRAGLVTDVTLFEDYPSHYLAYARRLHRWVRGDWQLLPWLLPKVPHAAEGLVSNDLSVLDRWKVLDNLRRSLLALGLVALLIAGWLWFPGSALVWTLAGVLTLAVPFVTSTVARLAQRLRGRPLTRARLSPQAEAVRWLLALVFLPYEASLVLDAVGCTLVRLTITHKHLLQWTTAAHTIRLFGKETRLGLIWRHMSGGPLLALDVALLMALIRPAALPVAAPLLAMWLVSPAIAHWMSRPAVQKQAPLSPDQCQRLRSLARRTWLYFEQFTGPDDNWLPPDHYQEDPRGLVAHRTSPTNLGLMLLSTLAAYDLGYVGPMEMALRLRYAFATMDRLERYRGHFLNWYDTSNLEPLPPRYVSTVDSGNLAGCLLALRQGCLALPQSPAFPSQRWEGLLDTLGIMAEIVKGLARSPERVQGTAGLETAVGRLEAHLAHIRGEVTSAKDAPERWASLLARLCQEDWQELDRLFVSLVESGAHILEAATLRDLRIWSERVHHHLLNAQGQLDLMLPWLLPLSRPPELFAHLQIAGSVAEAWQALVDALPAMPRLGNVPEICEIAQARLTHLQDLLSDGANLTCEPCPELVEWVREARAWCAALAEGVESARTAVNELLEEYQELSAWAEACFQNMDFAFLFNRRRQVFHIGHNVTAGRLDSNAYDLLASESRIASLIAIAKGDVPQSHWLHLARPLSRVNGTPALLSWNGSMFEYLMPSLLMRSYPDTLVDQSHRAVVDRQVSYARGKGVPWGISESGYYRFDANMNYQYRGFGVPGLGLKRGLADDLVISPYASLLALSLRPQAVMGNVEHLIERQMLGRCGFYEAIDFTASRLSAGQKSAIVYSHMAHHQGMILLALANYLQDEPMVQRFHADPRVQSAALLLQEQVPQQAPVEAPYPVEVSVLPPIRPRPEWGPWPVSVEAPLPQVHFLSNGRYGLLITAAGSGYSCWRGVDLTRWRADTTLEDWGTWVYVQDRDSSDIWSAGYQPIACQAEKPEVIFHAHKAEFRRRDHDISLHMEITVAPADDVEVRCITLTNHSDRIRRLMVTSYAEVVLAPGIADRRHPAFNKLFVQSEYLPQLNGLLFRRRPRSAEEMPVHLAHLLVAEQGREITGLHVTDRLRFLGRGGSLRSPAGLTPASLQAEASVEPSEEAEGRSSGIDAPLDPIMAMGQEIDLEPYGSAQVAYVTLAAGSRQEALSLASRYQAFPAIERAYEQARLHSELELRQLDLSTPEVEQIQKLLSVLLFPHPALRADPATLAANRKGQPGLWPYAISGDYPILLVHIGSQEEIALVRQLLRAHTYWRNRQVKIDLVILNEQDVGYAQELHDQLHRLITRTGNDAWLNRHGGIFLLGAGQMDEADRVLLETAARVVLDGKKGLLAEQLEHTYRQPIRLPRFIPTQPRPDEVEPTSPLVRPSDLLFDNGLGGFSADGREYVIYLQPGQWTPAPWINVIANPHFGFLISEAGGGYTWAENSGENRLTPWRNDPAADAPGEALYLRDEDTGQVWSPTPLPARAPAPYLIRYGAGYSIFEHHSHGLKQRLRLFAVRDAPVKVVQLRLENTWSRTRRITATYYAEWVLGTNREEMQQYVVPEFDATSHALLCRNSYNAEFGQRVAFLAAAREPYGLTTDRTEFLGRMGSLDQPSALDRVGLTGTVEAGLDACGAIQVLVWLAPGEAKEVTFLLGEGADAQEALRLVTRFQRAAQTEAAWEAVIDFWDSLLGSVVVQTPEPAMNLLLNRWLLYQALSCRVWGRSALYQSSGAFGYRDQLQDVMALLHSAPEIAREHILRTARHQFEEGDVLHWWHPPSGRGVRTRISDDLLWLPFVTAHYVATTGDESILSEEVPFLTGAPLQPTEEDRYGRYETAAKEGTLYEHCRRALARGATVGPHGLPLMGGGDWNDGMNRVGIEGKGESVWLGWFLYATWMQFAPLCERMGDDEQAAQYREQARHLREALEENGWDGKWYRRAYYDDGTPLGSAQNRECRIDSIAQSWAVLSAAGDPVRTAQAMDALAEQLVRPEDQLVLLFAPPFDRTARDPGYIKGYAPGIRENGGQYTHAALWTAWAFAKMGQGDRAEQLFRFLNPVYHSDTAERMSRYRVEPYVVAADIYSVPPHTGRGGWTWYTGAASWMYRLGLEAILGLRRVGKAVKIQPCIPRHWLDYELAYRDGDTVYQIHVENPDGVNQGVRRVTLDGEILPGGLVPLLGDGRHHRVHVLMGRSGGG